jgi:FAD dependent oxidoreductase
MFKTLFPNFVKIFCVLLVGKLLIDNQVFSKIINQVKPTVDANATGEKAKKSDATSKLTKQPPVYQNFDVVVYGDEVPGICAAVWAKKALGNKGKVALVRSNKAHEMLGGLLTRGGLAYLDYDKIPDWYYQPYAQCFKEFLDKSQVVDYCIEPQPADNAIKEMLSEAGVTVISDAKLTPQVTKDKIEYVEINDQNIRLKADSFIDATQDAELARNAGLSYARGYEGQDAHLTQETLAVSLVPIIHGLAMEDLQKMEDNIIFNTALVDELKNYINKYQTEAVANFWLKNFWSPMYKSYRDGYTIRSAALGAAYHYENNIPFTQDGFFFDKANVCVYRNGDISWNGFLFKYPTDIAMKLDENGRKPTPEMIKKMSLLQNWLQKYSQKDVRVILPPEVYVRHTVSIKDVVDPLTGQEIIRGGTAAENSIGSFSYDFDFRGGVRGLSVKIPPLPVFNFGIENALATKVNNLGIVSRSSGYVGVGVSVGRILTLNIYQGQAVGVAAAMAKELGVPLNSMKSAQVRKTLESLTNQTTYFYGKDTSNGQDISQVK